MNNKARTALKASIEHWYRISACTTNDALAAEGYDGDSCPLCEVYAPTDIDDTTEQCEGCPVREKTGICSCRHTPYRHAAISLDAWLFNGEWTEHDQANIEAEIRFLEGLL